MSILPNSLSLLMGILLFELVLLFFTTRTFITQIYTFLFHITKNHFFASSCIAVLYFPGTVLHELAHYIVALILFLPIQSMELFPHIEEGYIKLGSVTYEKKDVLRGFLVGIAPLFVGLGSLFAIFYTGYAAHPNIWIFLITWYLIFTISSTMFSSSQDLVDMIFAIPLIIMIALVIYILQIDSTIISVLSSFSLIKYLKNLIVYLSIPIILYGTLIILIIFHSKKRKL